MSFLPEMKVIKPSDSRWLAHEWSVKAVKVSYTALVVTLDSNYQNFHHLKLRDYTRLYPSLPPLQPFIYWITLVDGVLHALDDAIAPAAYWVLEILDSMDDLQQATGEIVSADKITYSRRLWRHHL